METLRIPEHIASIRHGSTRTAANWLLITNHQPPTTNHQPSTINHQPSTINHQPSTINHQPSTINHQLTDMNIENKITNIRETKTPTSKTHRRFKPALAIGGLALGLSLTSCVDPSLTYSQGQYSPFSTGYRVSALPSGYRTESISGRTYYYHNGHYYQPGANGYSVVEAPRNSRYYDDYNSRRQSYNSDRGDRSSYGRNDRQYDRSQVISRLPGNPRVIQHGGNSYYRSENQYYRRQGDGYIMVDSPY